MSTYEKQQFVHNEIQQMGILHVSLILLFVVVLFCSFAVPALKNQYGSSLVMTYQQNK